MNPLTLCNKQSSRYPWHVCHTEPASEDHTVARHPCCYCTQTDHTQSDETAPTLSPPSDPPCLPVSYRQYLTLEVNEHNQPKTSIIATGLYESFNTATCHETQHLQCCVSCVVSLSRPLSEMYSHWQPFDSSWRPYCSGHPSARMLISEPRHSQPVSYTHLTLPTKRIV